MYGLLLHEEWHTCIRLDCYIISAFFWNVTHLMWRCTGGVKMLSLIFITSCRISPSKCSVEGGWSQRQVEALHRDACGLFFLLSVCSNVSSWWLCNLSPAELHLFFLFFFFFCLHFVSPPSPDLIPEWVAAKNNNTRYCPYLGMQKCAAQTDPHRGDKRGTGEVMQRV